MTLVRTARTADIEKLGATTSTQLLAVADINFLQEVTLQTTAVFLVRKGHISQMVGAPQHIVLGAIPVSTKPTQAIHTATTW